VVSSYRVTAHDITPGGALFLKNQVQKTKKMAENSSRSLGRRIRVGDNVHVCVDHLHELLSDMELYDSDDKMLTDVHMFGVVQSSTPNHYSVFLPAAEESLMFTKERCMKVMQMNTDDLHVVVNKKIKTIKGLLLPSTYLPTDYYRTEKEAKDAISEADAGFSRGGSMSVSTTAPPVSANVVAVNKSITTPQPPSTIRRPRRSNAVTPASEENLTVGGIQFWALFTRARSTMYHTHRPSKS